MTYHKRIALCFFWHWRLAEAFVAAEGDEQGLTPGQAQEQANHETYAQYPEIPRAEIHEVLKTHLAQVRGGWPEGWQP